MLFQQKCPAIKICFEREGGAAKHKKNHEYYDQVQRQMALTGAKWCDFLVYTSVGLNIDRIYFKEQHWKKLRERLCSVYFTYFLLVAAKLNYNS